MAKTLTDFVTELSQNAELVAQCRENLEGAMDSYNLDEEGRELMRGEDPVAIKTALGLDESEDLPDLDMPIFRPPD
jgi:hypothetical protein